MRLVTSSLYDGLFPPEKDLHFVRRSVGLERYGRWKSKISSSHRIDWDSTKQNRRSSGH